MAVRATAPAPSVTGYRFAAPSLPRSSTFTGSAPDAPCLAAWASPDMFDPLIDRQNMTATEIMARVEQKLRFLTPIIGRLQSGLFNPMIQRIIGILGRQGKLPDMPEELVDKDFSVMYLGRLALALRTIETEGLTKTLLEWKPLADMNILDWLDHINIPVAFRDSARNNGVPATWLRNEDDVKQIQADRAADQAQQQMLEAAPELGKAYKSISGKPEEGSPAEEIVNAA